MSVMSVMYVMYVMYVMSICLYMYVCMYVCIYECMYDVLLMTNHFVFLWFNYLVGYISCLVFGLIRLDVKDAADRRRFFIVMVRHGCLKLSYDKWVKFLDSIVEPREFNQAPNQLMSCLLSENDSRIVEDLDE